MGSQVRKASTKVLNKLGVTFGLLIFADAFSYLLDSQYQTSTKYIECLSP